MDSNSVDNDLYQFYLIRVTDSEYDLIDYTDDIHYISDLYDMHCSNSKRSEYVNRDGEITHFISEEIERPCVVLDITTFKELQNAKTGEEVLQLLYLNYPVPSLLYQELEKRGSLCYL